MEHTYHVQREVARYYNHISKVPDTFPVNPALLSGLSEAEFRAAFTAFVDIMKAIYHDMERAPEGYSLPLVPIGAINENKADGNLAKASWRAIKRLGDVINALGALGTIADGVLTIPTMPLRAALKPVTKAYQIYERMTDFGFIFTGYSGGKYAKGADALTLAFPDNPGIITVLHAYAIAPPFFTDMPDPHEFYYFDYKRVAQRDKLPKHAAAQDMAALLNAGDGAAFMAFHTGLTDGLGLSAHYKDESFEYFLKGKRVARIIVDFKDMSLWVNVKVKQMDNYIDLISALPPGLRAVFEHSTCRYCGFQGATDEHCKFRISWSLDGHKHEACGFYFAGFKSPGKEDAEALCGLMKAEYGLAVG